MLKTYKLTYDKHNSLIVLECNNKYVKFVESFIIRFGYEYNISNNVDSSIFYIKIMDKENYKKFNALWKSAKQFIF